MTINLLSCISRLILLMGSLSDMNHFYHQGDLESMMEVLSMPKLWLLMSNWPPREAVHKVFAARKLECWLVFKHIRRLEVNYSTRQCLAGLGDSLNSRRKIWHSPENLYRSKRRQFVDEEDREVCGICTPSSTASNTWPNAWPVASRFHRFVDPTPRISYTQGYLVFACALAIFWA